MTRFASSPNSVGSTSSNGLEEALTRFQNDIDAVAVGVSVGDGSLSKNISRSTAASRLLAEVWEHGAPGLMQQARASAGAIGTNKLRGVADGPVCGKLIATALRDSTGNMTGLVVALRTVEQDKFTQRESQKIVDLAAVLVTLLRRKTPEPPVGLMSWSVFEERATAQERTATASGCVLYGNVDQLHVLNKLAGFASGDRAIAAVGEVLQNEKHLPAGAGACHLSGDRFTVYLPATPLPIARRMAELLSRAVSERCAKLDGLRTKLSISFGVAEIPESESGVTQALAGAEAACRAAKDRGRGRVEVYQDIDQSSVRRDDDVAIAGRLRKALETDRFAIVAQPLHRLQEGGEPDCYELLVRFVDETGVLLAAGSFMSAAKRYQLLVELDRAVISKVFDALKIARAQRESHGARYSLNLSGPTIGDPAFLEWLLSYIGPQGVPGDWLQFELTESAAVAHVNQTQTLIRKLRARGVEFALDDFGTGASSLSYLKTFDVSMLKLDGSFTRDLLTDPRSESLVRGIAQLGRGMNIQTVAECVETEAVRDRLKDLGIDRAQGFFYGQPVPFEQVLAERAGAPPSMLSPAAIERVLTEPVAPRAAELVAARLSESVVTEPAARSAGESVAIESVAARADDKVVAASATHAGERAVIESVAARADDKVVAASATHAGERAVIESAAARADDKVAAAFATQGGERAVIESVAARADDKVTAVFATQGGERAVTESAAVRADDKVAGASATHGGESAVIEPVAARAGDIVVAESLAIRADGEAIAEHDAPRIVEPIEGNAPAQSPAPQSEPAIASVVLASVASPDNGSPSPSELAAPIAAATSIAEAATASEPPAPRAEVARVEQATPMQVALQEQTDSASELAQLAKSAEALAAESEELMVATGQIVALSQQLAKSHASFDNSAIDPNHNDPTVEQPAAVMVAQSEMMLEQQHPDSASAQVESTVEQPRPPIIAAG